MRAVKVPFPVVETAPPPPAAVSSYPVRTSLIFLKPPCARTTAVADTNAITAIDTNSLRIRFTSRVSVVATWGAHNIIRRGAKKAELATKRQTTHKKFQTERSASYGFYLCAFCAFCGCSLVPF